jgi:hypothetical protein
MKSRTAISLVLIALFVSGVAQAQSQASQEKSDPQSLIQNAITVASNTKHPDLSGYLAIYISPDNWAAGLKDGDLGPFLKLKEGKPGRSVVFLFSQSKDSAICVYFDGAAAIGVTSAKAGADGKIADKDISGEYKDVTKEMLKETGQPVHLESGDISTDDGVPLPAYQITSAAKKPAN